MAPPELTHCLVETIKQSSPVDTSAPYDAAGVAGKTILITGGASGLGAAFARHWASHGANVVIGDLNDAAGEALVAELRASTGSRHHHYQRCDVTDWQSQVSLFQTAARVSPTGGVDAVVPNAGIADHLSPATGLGFENPRDLDADAPPPPDLKVLDVNLKGVMYTIHLALFWLPQESGNEHQPRRDRHLLLIGSVAGLIPLPGQLQYTGSKHAVTGFFRALRGTVWRQGIRVNMLCPYFVDTGIVPKAGLLFLAGGGTAQVSDVVDAATRFMADESIAGRALVVGPRMKVDEGCGGGEPRVVDVPTGGSGEGKAAWECYAHDYDNVELMVWRYTKLLNGLVQIRGWVGWFQDVVRILFFRKDRGR